MRNQVLSSLHKRASKRDVCNLYKSPQAGAVIDSSQPLNLQWDTTCFNNTAAVDIFLLEPYATGNPKLQVWQDVNYADGQLPITLLPRWWNATDNVQLRFTIQKSGDPFASQYGPGPLFNATYTPPSDGKVAPGADTSIHDSGFQLVKNFLKSLSKGEVAVAIILPLLLIAGGLFALYVRRSRARVAAKRRRFSAALDKRMSTISGNWASLSAAGAQAAIRNSMATFGRPSDVGTGVGARRSMAARSATRVSFAADSMYGPRASVADIPPVPVHEKERQLAMSPTQTAGARALDARDISRLAGHPYGRVSVAASAYYESDPLDKDVLPALAMMQGADGELLLSPPPVPQDMPLPPVPAAHAPPPTSPLGPMPLSPASGLGPDALMRQYAAQRAAGALSPLPRAVYSSMHGSGSSSPVPSSAPYAPSLVPSTPHESAVVRASTAPTEASVYSGLEYDHGHGDDEHDLGVGHAA